MSTLAPARPRRPVWNDRTGAGALAVLVAVGVWRGLLLARSFFNQDDFYLTGRADRADLTWSFLVRDTAGHVNPLQQLTYWALTRLAPLDWGVVAGFVLTLQLLTLVVWWHVLCRLLPGRPVRLVLLAVLGVAPLTLATTLWWSAAMGLWPHLLCSMTAVLFLLRHRDGDGRAWVDQGVVVLAVMVGLLWHERAVLIAPVLVATAFLTADGGSALVRARTALARFRWTWVALTLLLTGFLVAHALLTDVDGGSASAGALASITWAFLGQNVAPGLVGGPWTARLEGGAVVPPVWVTVVSLVALAGVVAVVVRRGGPARWWALAALAGYVLADLALLLAGRSGFGRVIGLDPRYSSDVVHAAVLFCAMALRRPAGADPVTPPRRRDRVLVGAVGVAYVAAAAVGTAVLVPHFQNTEDRAYLTRFRTDLAVNPNQVVWDALAPEDVVLPLVGEDSLVSRIVGQLPEDPAFDLPSARLRLLGDDGSLSPAEIADPVEALDGPNPGCGYQVRRLPVQVRFPFDLSGRLLVHAAFFTDVESTVRVDVGSWQTTFAARAGPGEMWVPIPDLGPYSTLTLRVLGPSAVCFTELEAGLP